MYGAVDHLGAEMNAKAAYDPDPKAVSQNAKWNNKTNEKQAFPGCAQKKMSGEQTGDKKDPT